MGHLCTPLYFPSSLWLPSLQNGGHWEGAVEKSPPHSLPCQTVLWSLAEAHRADGEAKLLCEVPAVGGHRHVPERKEVQVLLELQHSLAWGGVLFQSRHTVLKSCLVALFGRVCHEPGLSVSLSQPVASLAGERHPLLDPLAVESEEAHLDHTGSRVLNLKASG